MERLIKNEVEGFGLIWGTVQRFSCISEYLCRNLIGQLCKANQNVFLLVAPTPN
jgi:hypothetical protein